MRELYNKHIRDSRAECLYAIIDKSPASNERMANGKYAGILSLLDTSLADAATEIGIIIAPKFQHTHAASNAIGLMLLYTLDPPSMGGLGLICIAWQCHANNEASRRVALSMDSEFEGIARWKRVLPGSGVGLPAHALQ
jgi:RimJ/RimL family protein N-acetyltransferase